MANKYSSTRSGSSSRSSKTTFKNVILVILIIALAAGGAFYYRAYVQQRNRAELLSNPEEAAKEETKQLINSVSQLTDLPDEEPTIATVRDVKELEGQSFFENAQNGDKVLIFTKAKKAILYRPSSNKVIEIAPVSLGNNDGIETQNSTSSEEKDASKKPESTTTGTQSDDSSN